MNLEDMNKTQDQELEISDAQAVQEQSAEIKSQPDPIMQDDEKNDPIMQDDEKNDPIMQDDGESAVVYRMGTRSVKARHGKSQKKSFKKELMGWVITIVAAIIIAVLVRSFVFIMVQVDGSSMLDTLHNENRLFVWRAGYLFDAPQRGDVVICHYPELNGKYTDTNYVKRVIGLPGDTVSIIAGDVFINDQKLEEPYLTAKRKNTKEYMAPFTLGEDEFFVMGDNRSNSRDSRYVGPINRDQIVGKAIWKVYPFNEMGSVE